MGQALYRKYRSHTLADVVGQEHVTKTLEKAIKGGKISHAYLFTGPRGVGKTSVARILAHEVNNLPYSDESIHLDIIEIDAASNRRIDEIRELRERVNVTPTSAKYKVYIIDEVHMLTREAFNALLKTLEEPPAHCIFILATTEAHKLPETIVSRTQHFTFKPAEKGDIKNHLDLIAKREKITIQPDALQLLSEHSSGSFRDSIGMLDQLSSAGGEITEEQVRAFMGLPSEEVIFRLIDNISAGDSQAMLTNLDALKDQGSNAAIVARELAAVTRQKLVDNTAPAWSAKLLQNLLDVPASSRPQEQLEISLLSLVTDNGPGTVSQPSEDIPSNNTVAGPKVEKELPKAATPRPEIESEVTDPVKAKKTDFDLEQWPQIVELIKSEDASLYTALRLATPQLAKDRLILAFRFPLHQKKVNQAKQLDTIGQTIEEFTGSKLHIECIVDKESAKDQTKQLDPAKTAQSAPPLDTISNIFGTAEVLES